MSQSFLPTREFADNLDRADGLAGFRDKFHIPTDGRGDELVYFCGNSLGLQPKITENYLKRELDDWARMGVTGHEHAKKPWMPYHEFLTEKMAKIVGALPEEVVTMNSLTANLHLMMASFYQPTADRYKIIIEENAFPSDRYAAESQLKFHDHNPDGGLLIWKSRPDEELLHIEDLESLLDEHGNETALLLIGTPNYYTGQSFPIAEITRLGHKHGCKVGFDLAHGAGNIQPNLHDNGPDFAVWCTYKYLNSGPGSLGGCFVHRRHGNNPELKRFAGWWGHNKETRFNMRKDFDVMPGAEGWQLSNPAILSMAAIRASLDLFDEAGFENLRGKSEKLTAYFHYLVKNLNDARIKIITPEDPGERGCQLSITIANADKTLHEKLEKAGVITDWREPDVIRAAPVPLYNSYLDVWKAVSALNNVLEKTKTVG